MLYKQQKYVEYEDVKEIVYLEELAPYAFIRTKQDIDAAKWEELFLVREVEGETKFEILALLDGLHPAYEKALRKKHE